MGLRDKNRMVVFDVDLRPNLKEAEGSWAMHLRLSYYPLSLRTEYQGHFNGWESKSLRIL